MPVHIVLILMYRLMSGRTAITPARSKPIAAIPTHFETLIVPTSVYLPSSIGGTLLQSAFCRIGGLGARRGPNIYFCWHADGQNRPEPVEGARCGEPSKCPKSGLSRRPSRTDHLWSRVQIWSGATRVPKVRLAVAEAVVSGLIIATTASRPAKIPP
jgi:hypothetical protein